MLSKKNQTGEFVYKHLSAFSLNIDTDKTYGKIV